MKIFFGKQENIQSQSSCLLVVPKQQHPGGGRPVIGGGPGQGACAGPGHAAWRACAAQLWTRRTRGAGGTRAARTAAATVRTRAAACLMTTRPLGTKCTSKLF